MQNRLSATVRQRVGCACLGHLGRRGSSGAPVDVLDGDAREHGQPAPHVVAVRVEALHLLLVVQDVRERVRVCKTNSLLSSRTLFSCLFTSQHGHDVQVLTVVAMVLRFLMLLRNGPHDSQPTLEDYVEEGALTP